MHPGAPTTMSSAGHMIGGFGVVAFPARYGQTGVMTFIVNHDGVVYQKDLGDGDGAHGGGDEGVRSRRDLEARRRRTPPASPGRAGGGPAEPDRIRP